MAKDIRVLIVEDDYYARTWMEMLLRRDWRTKVIRVVNSPAELSIALEVINNHNERIDMVLIDTEIPHDPRWLIESLRSLSINSPKTAILYMGVAPNAQIAQLRASSNFAGYILKGEICHSLAWAVSLATEGRIVVTPGVRDLFEKNYSLPSGSLILDGRKPIVAFSKRDQERSRMAFIFSMERHEFADELGITEDYSYGVVSALYDKMGLNDVLEGKVEPEQFLGNHPAVINQLKRTLEHLKSTGSTKAKNMESLAFHLLTMPDIDEIP